MSTNQIQVINIPPGVTENELQQFFESQKCCPLGGATEWIQINANDGTAIVAFKDTNVAQQLVSTRNIKFRDRPLVIVSAGPDNWRENAEASIDLKSAAVVNFLLSTNGQKWLDKLLAKYNLEAVIYEVTGCASKVGLAAADEKTSQLVERIIRDSIISKERAFNEGNVPFLKSKKWTDLVAHWTASKCGVDSLEFVSVQTDFKKRRIIVEGCATVVKDIMSLISQHLKRKSDVSRPFPLPTATFELLKKHFLFDIQQAIDKDCPPELSPANIDVSKDGRGFVLTGSADAVDRAVTCVQSKFASRILSTAVAVDKIGLSMSDFTTFASEGHKSVEFCQTEWKCYIRVYPDDDNCDQNADDILHTNALTNIEIASGNLADFQADALVNLITSAKPDLTKSGTLAEAFVKAAGSSFSQLQDDLKGNWPVNFGRDVVATQGYGCGKNQARRIYHAAIRKHRDSVSYKLLEDMMIKCLKLAEGDQLSSIAFPTAGCGEYLGYETQSVARCFVNAARTCNSKLKIYIVVYADDKAKDQFQQLVAHHGQTSKQSGSGSPSPSTQIEVCAGNLADFKADVLVNLVTSDETRLDAYGAVAASLVKAAGPQLQQDFDSLSLPKKFGTDVAVTAATGQLQAKHVYHAAIRKYRDDISKKLMYDMICTCLKMSSSSGMTSIAFPTVGCGALDYDVNVVAECFVNAVKNTGTNLKVYVVAIDDEIRQKIDAVVSARASSEHAPAVNRRAPVGMGGTVSGRIRFNITALDSAALTAVKHSLIAEVEKMISKEEITLCEDQEVSPVVEGKIKALQSPACNISIDKTGKKVKIEGKRSDVDRVKQDVIKLLLLEESLSVKLERIKLSKGVDAYLQQLGRSAGDRFPPYWKCAASDTVATMTKVKRIELKQSQEDYKEVEKIIMSTWETTKVGHGNDAVNLTHKSITVKKIWRIENPTLYRAYYTKLKNICFHGATHKIPSIDGLNGEREVITRKQGLKHLDSNVIREINECYLFHGTKRELVDTIVKDGADIRLARDGMFGKGTYMAESSTKSDQYADNPSSRVGTNQPLNMFVVRALLGNPFVCQTGRNNFRRPPCATNGCSRGDGCTDHTHEAFHSVVGTHKDQSTRLIFREFIVFDPCQMYPEYLVEYERN